MSEFEKMRQNTSSDRLVDSGDLLANAKNGLGRRARANISNETPAFLKSDSKSNLIKVQPLNSSGDKAADISAATDAPVVIPLEQEKPANLESKPSPPPAQPVYKFTPKKPKEEEEEEKKVPVVKVKSNLKYRIAQFVFDTICVVFMVGVCSALYFVFPPNSVYITCGDSDITYPLQTETVPVWLLGLYCGLPVIVFVLFSEVFTVELLVGPKREEEFMPKEFIKKLKHYLICVMHAFALFAFGLAATVLISELGKRWVGRPSKFQFILFSRFFAFFHNTIKFSL
jgi:hypothetical protein